MLQWILPSYFYSTATVNHWCPCSRRGPLIPILTKTCQTRPTSDPLGWQANPSSPAEKLYSVCHQHPSSIKENSNGYATYSIPLPQWSWHSGRCPECDFCFIHLQSFWLFYTVMYTNALNQTTRVRITYFSTPVLFLSQQTGHASVMAVKNNCNNWILYSIFRGQTVRSWMFTHYHGANKQCQVCSTNRIKHQDFMSFTAAARHRPGNNGISFEAVHHGGNHLFLH